MRRAWRWLRAPLTLHRVRWYERSGALSAFVLLFLLLAWPGPRPHTLAAFLLSVAAGTCWCFVYWCWGWQRGHRTFRESVAAAVRAAAPLIPVSPEQRADIERPVVRERDAALAEIGIRDRSIKSLMDEVLRLVNDVKELQRQRADIEREALLRAASDALTAFGLEPVMPSRLVLWLEIRARAASVGTEEGRDG